MIRPKAHECWESFHCNTILIMADFEIFSELCAYQSLKKMRGNNEKRGRVTQVDRAAWHRTEEEKLLMMIKIFCVKIQRWQSDLVSLRSSKHQSEAGQIKDPTMRSSLMMMIEPKHLIFSHTKIPSLKILECGVKELPQTV